VSRLHVIFDLDDTLYPERSFAHAGFEEAGLWAEKEWGVKGLGQDMRRMFDEGYLGKLFPMALKARIPDATPEQVAALHHAYRSARPLLELFPDGQWALDHYGSKGPIGLITDGTLVMQQSKVAGLRIADRFAEIVYTDALGDARAFFKPHPMSYEVIRDKLGRSGDRFVYIGDNPAKDFVSPNAMGWTSIQVVRSGGIHEGKAVADGGAAQHQIPSLRDLPGILGV